MEFKQYQDRSRETAVYPGLGSDYTYPAFGLAGETGEVMEKLKKLQRDHDNVLTDEYRKAIAKEIGDLLWYVSNLCTELGLDLADVAEMNLEKLKSRKERGTLKGSGDTR